MKCPTDCQGIYTGPAGETFVKQVSIEREVREQRKWLTGDDNGQNLNRQLIGQYFINSDLCYMTTLHSARRGYVWLVQCRVCIAHLTFCSCHHIIS